jgi:hypothetical protein
MGGPLHRIEILLLAVLLLLGGAISTALFLVRPSSPTYGTRPAEPVVIPTPKSLDDIPAPTAQLAASPAVALTLRVAAPTAAPTAATGTVTVASSVVIPSVLAGFGMLLEPGVLLAVPSWLLLVVVALRMRHRHRMPLTRQKLDHFVDPELAADSTIAGNLKVLRDLNAQGLLTPVLKATLAKAEQAAKGGKCT